MRIECDVLKADLSSIMLVVTNYTKQRWVRDEVERMKLRGRGSITCGEREYEIADPKRKGPSQGPSFTRHVKVRT